MAFTWEVEVLRKILDTILEGGEAQERYDFGKDLLEKSKKGQAKKSDAAIRDEKIAREQFELGPDDPLPAHWEVDDMGLAWDLTPFDRQEKQKDELLQREKSARTSDPNDPRNYDWDDRGAFLRAQRTYDAQQKRKDAAIKTLDEMDDPFGLSEVAPWEGIPMEEYYRERDISKQEDATSKLKLDWVNEILQEFQEDKAPEVLRLPHLKEEKDMSPFLSYLLSQSPYARLPAAGLLGIGSLLYSKPAY